MGTAQHRIFVSHSHIDNEFGTRLAQDLRRVLGDDGAVWYDVLGLHGGETWWEKIVEELTARDVFILVLSPDAMNSPWVRREIGIALNDNKFILPVLYRDCNIRADLRTIQIISFLAPKVYEDAFKEVLVALGLPASRQARPAPMASQPEHTGTTLLRQIEAAFAAQDWYDVIRKVDFLTKHQPESVTVMVYRLQGLAYLEEGEEQHAQEALETALALVTDRQQRLTLLSDYTALLAKQHQWDRVLKRAREALRLVPNDPGWLATQEQAQNQLRGETSTHAQPQEQEHTRDKGTPLAPQKSKEDWLKEGYALYNLKRYEEALTAYEQAIRLDPNYALAYYNRGIALNELKRYEEALSAYEQAIRLNPNHADAYHGKGKDLNDLKRHEEALTALDQAIRLNPTNFAISYNSKGAALYGLKRYEEALSAYEQAIRLDPNYALAYNNKGNALYGLKRYEEALSAYDQAIRLNPNHALAYYNKGLALRYLKRNQEAEQAFEKARKLGYGS
jgi:tetratricopeptide (TPR) repeat protein